MIDETRRQVTAHGSPAELTTTEWKLLTTLASVTGRVFSRYELVNRVRGYEYEGYERTIDSHIRNLRRKIETDPHAPPGSSTPSPVPATGSPSPAIAPSSSRSGQRPGPDPQPRGGADHHAVLSSHR